MISVIIPAYNAAARIGACLDALERQTVPRDQYEIIVVDDGSRDATVAAATRPGVLVLSQAHSSAAAARNRGVSAARGDLLFFTDADCVPDPDWIERMRAPFADPRVMGCKGVYRTQQREVVARFVQLEYEDKYDRLRRWPAIDFIDTYSAGYRRAAFEAAGGFDAGLLFAEDQELSFRIAATGARLVFAPEAVVGHLHAPSLAAYARKKFLGAFWKTRVVGRHRSKLVSDAHTPQVMKAQVLLVLLGAALLPLGLWRRGFAALSGLCALAFLLSTLPFLRKGWPKDRQATLVAPLLLFARAAAGGAGIVVALLRAAGLRLRGRAD